MELTDAQWELLRPLVEPGTPKKRRGRPWRETRQVLEGVLWILRTSEKELLMVLWALSKELRGDHMEVLKSEL